MYKSYKYRLYPNKYQQLLIESTFDCCRLVYNLALETKIVAYKSAGINLSVFDLCHQLTDLKKEYKWLCVVNSQALQASVKKIDFSFRQFFKGNGFPKFKSKRGRQSFQIPNGIRIVNFGQKTISVPKLVNIKAKLSRRFRGDIKTITISRTSTGKYFASVLVDDRKQSPVIRPINNATSIGLDLGLKHFVVLSNGKKIKNPKYLYNKTDRLTCLQRRLTKKEKGSKNREKARLKVALLHEKVANKRKDFIHKTSTAITKQYDTICIESLNINNMRQNRQLSRAISDVAWGEFLRQLEYKMAWKGGTVLRLPIFYPSSKKCNCCGAINEALTLSIREWMCTECGAKHDRDENAAKNIRNYFFTITGGHPGIACGGADISPANEAGKQRLIC